MSILKEKKKQIIEKFKQNEKDTGSPGVQVAILTERIINLTEHLETHKKDFHCRRGLIMLIGQRKRLLKYLHSVNPEEYGKLIKELKIRSIIKEYV
jgi:small subunit ribosomal protein S15